MREYDTNTTGDDLLKDLSGEIKDKVILTTGVSPGTLGGFFVETIAKAQPSTLILAGRSEERTRKTASVIQAAYPNIKVYTLHLNLSSLAAVREAAATVYSWQHTPVIDVIVNNAGLMATDFSLTVDGYETQLASNHLGHFLFTNLVMQKLLASKSPRVVNVSSDGHRLSPIRWADHNFSNGETYNRWRAYGQSKTANMLMAISLAEKLGPKHGLTAFSLHPGVISTSLGAHLDFSVEIAELAAVDKSLGNAEGWADFKWKTPERGVATHIYAAFEPSLKERNGAYLENSHVADPYTDTVKPWATSSIEADRLWKLSEKLVGQEFQY
ncbi:hypothetical protein GGI43DRAFT_427645 [Trichoderma evansii]